MMDALDCVDLVRHGMVRFRVPGGPVVYTDPFQLEKAPHDADLIVVNKPRGLVVHWLINSLPDLFLLFVLLWFALRAKTMAEDLGRCLQGGSRLRRTMPVGKLLLDYGLALLLAALLSALGAALAVIFAGVLL